MPNADRRLLLIACAALPFLLISASPPAGAQQIVAPNSLATTPGDIDDSFPFFSSGIRYQQVYDASQFATLTKPTLLTAIAFRPYSGETSSILATISHIQIDFSTTAKSSTSLSSTFSSNVGANDTVVYNGSLTLSSAGAPSSGTAPFDIVISLATPFLYDPTQGNLLMDVRDFSGEPLGAYSMDATSSPSNGVERVFSAEGSEGSLTGTVDNGSINDAGLITLLTFGTVSVNTPEPGTLALLATGAFPLVGMIVKRRRRR